MKNTNAASNWTNPHEKKIKDWLNYSSAQDNYRKPTPPSKNNKEKTFQPLALFSKTKQWSNPTRPVSKNSA